MVSFSREERLHWLDGASIGADAAGSTLILR